jgi:hypothetical protein
MNAARHRQALAEKLEGFNMFGNKPSYRIPLFCTCGYFREERGIR